MLDLGWYTYWEWNLGWGWGAGEDLFYKPRVPDRYKLVKRWCLFIFFMVLFDEQQKLSLMEPKLSIYVLNIDILLKQKKKNLYISKVIVLVYFLSLWQTAWPQEVWKRKGFIWPISLSLRKSELETEGRRLKKTPQRDSAYWLSPSKLFCSYSYTAQAVSKDGIFHNELGPSTSISNWEVRRCLIEMATHQSDWSNFSVEISSSQMTIGHVSF